MKKRTMCGILFTVLAISLISASTFAAETNRANTSKQNFIVNGTPVNANAVVIDGYNYIKVAELAEFLDISIMYEEATKTVILDKSKPFSGVVTMTTASDYAIEAIPQNATGSGEGKTFVDSIEAGISGNNSSSSKAVKAKISEIQKAIEAIEGVEAAELSLRIPEESPLVMRQDDQPSATVTLEMSRELTSEQLKDIALFVSNCFTNIKLEDVTISDTNGNILLQNVKAEVSDATQTITFQDTVKTQISSTDGKERLVQINFALIVQKESKEISSDYEKLIKVNETKIMDIVTKALKSTSHSDIMQRGFADEFSESMVKEINKALNADIVKEFLILDFFYQR